jgi:hypothetical protein
MLELRTSLQDICAFVTCSQAAHYLRTGRHFKALKRDGYHSIASRSLQLFFAKFDGAEIDDLFWALDRFRKISVKEMPSGGDRADLCGRFSTLARRTAAVCAHWTVRKSYPNANVSHLIDAGEVKLRVDIECLAVLEHDGVAGLVLMSPDSELWSRILHRSLPAYIIRRAVRGIPGIKPGKSFIIVIDPTRDNIFEVRLRDRVRLPGDTMLKKVALGYSLGLTYPTRADRICNVCPFSSCVCPFGK